MSVDYQLSHLPERTKHTPSEGRPIVIGIYGLPRSGKTHLLNKLRERWGDTFLSYHEGSETIGEVTPGGLDAFKRLDDQMKNRYRAKAIMKTKEHVLNAGKVAIVTGHVMFWSDAENRTTSVYTEADLHTFTHIVYLGTPVATIEQRRFDDGSRSDSPRLSTHHLHRWQEDEEMTLRSLCYENGILFTVISCELSALLDQMSDLIWNFCSHNEVGNLVRATEKLDRSIAAKKDRLDTMLVIDADRTLTAADTGKMFWERVDGNGNYPLQKLFSSPMGYSYTAFRQAALLYSEVRSDDFGDFCRTVASSVTIRPEFLSLLHKVARMEHVDAVIVTCGLYRIWEEVLQQAGLSDSVKVIGAGCLTDDNACVVTAGLKAALVTYLHDTLHKYVWAFGDSILDLEMLRRADEAILLIGEEHTRSATTEVAFNEAVERNNLRARQVLLPSSLRPWLDATKIPVIEFPEISILHASTGHLEVVHATSKLASKLIATHTRDASMSGPVLRQAHRCVGRYLAAEFVTATVGLQSYEIPHVQGSKSWGYRLFDEEKTTIVALMRGGEPMASGVNDVFPLAMFVHAKEVIDLKAHHVLNQRTIVLVDSVVNSGKSILDFTNRIRHFHPSIRIVVVAAVVQSQAIFHDSPLVRAFGTKGKRTLIALRVSDNKYTGTGSSDTGNRLFNTTQIQ